MILAVPIFGGEEIVFDGKLESSKEIRTDLAPQTGGGEPLQPVVQLSSPDEVIIDHVGVEGQESHHPRGRESLWATRVQFVIDREFERCLLAGQK